jgi:cytochrome c5
LKRDYRCLVLLGLSFTCAGACVRDAAAGPKDQTQSPPTSRATTQKAAPKVNPGQIVFETNCGRCHNPPEELSPRAVRAVVRQMRVRANLSAEQERELIEFLAP